MLADPTDVHYLREVLAKGVVRSEVHIDQYQHLDFAWAEDAPELAYKHVLSFLSTMS